MLQHYVPAIVAQRGFLQFLAQKQSTRLNINQWAKTPVRQPSVDEMDPQDSLAPTPHSPIGMEPSAAATHSEPVAPQSHAETSLPPQVTVEETRECDGAGGSGNQALKPSSMKRFKRTTKRIVKCPPTCKSLFIAQCVKQFLKIPHADRVVADYALAEIGDPRYIYFF